MTQYIGVHSEGGLIPYDVLDKIAKEESGLGQQAKDFDLTAGRRLTDEIARAWSDAQDYWHIFQRRSSSLPGNETGATLTRKWITDLLNELLGYELAYQQTGAVIGGKNYPISHRAGISEESPPVQIEGFRADLDRRPQARRLSPQALVQEYLNNSDSQLWGIVTNGFLLRLLRDTSRTSRPSYLEFDLQSILEGNRFNEFALFYRVCHRTRLPRTAEDATSCWLEKYFQLSVEQGGRVRDKLRDGVEDALKTLGTGFLRHPNNEALRERVKGSTLTAAEFHRQLLRLVYRLLFLMVAEERRMIVPEGPEADRRQSLFDRYYSVGRLRNLAERSIESSTFSDLWIGLLQTFSLFEDGDSNPLGIPPLNGDLFSAIAVEDLQGTHLYNDVLLAAMQRLSLFEDHRVRQRVNYSALDVEELGSVYESLLDYQPVITQQQEGMQFELPIGGERKSTGSYYTRPELVRELIESALVPVMQDRLANAKDSDPAKEKERKQQAIFSISVCDPACGSGHFLLAAARRLGRELAKIRTGEDEPTPKEFHLAVRDVIAQCVYGVDVNPLAVDLCKLALWLEGHWTGKPLSFLDHRIKLGNSLVGVLDMAVLKEGIPDEAFNAVIGDDKKVASAFKKKNRDERKGQPSLPFDPAEHIHHYASESEDYATIAEDSPADVRRKKDAYEKTRQKPDWWHDWVAANLWTAAFFAPVKSFDDPSVPTFSKFAAYLRGGHVDGQLEGVATGFAAIIRFFHWQLEFPTVFERGGFDVIVGNPPWERIKLQEEEHWADDNYVASARNKAERFKRIEEYRTSTDATKQARVARFDRAKHAAECISKFVRHSNRFPLTAVGDINTFSIFAETAIRAANSRGRAGIIVPSAIATGETTSAFFSHIVESRRLVSMRDFLEARDFFEGLESRDPFCLLTLRGSASGTLDAASFTFQMLSPHELTISERNIQLTPSDFALLNPNTRTCPVFRTRSDSELAKKIYRRVPVLVNESAGENPWGVRFDRMFDMSNDSHLFVDKADLSVAPLYEAKMIHQFDHRWATYDAIIKEFRKTTDDEKADNGFSVTPRYWVPAREAILRASAIPPALATAVREESEGMAREALSLWLAGFLANGRGGRQLNDNLSLDVQQEPLLLEMTPDLIGDDKNGTLAGSWQRKWPLTEEDVGAIACCKSFLAAAWTLIEVRCPQWFLVFRGIARANDERTFISAVIPRSGVGNSAPLMQLHSIPPELLTCLLGNLNALVFDYVVRQKIGGANLNFFIVNQCPVLPPTAYSVEDTFWISRQVVRLVGTSNDLKSFTNALAVTSDNQEGAASLITIRAELDAYYAHLYGLTREELRYILDPKDVFGEEFPSETFRVLKENEEKEFGEYRTRRLVLEAFDKLAESPRFREDMSKRESSLEIPKKSAQVVAS